MSNLKKIIQKKCGSFKGKAKNDCVANLKRNRKEKKASNEQHGKNIDKMSESYSKSKNQKTKNTKKYGKSISNALETIRFKQSKEGKKWATKGMEKRRDVKKQKFPYSK
jgi:esterase/lipase|tara:strand:- start:182 stop:508 length:327 start_codon:yes stop_codon:yes gene_type:complete